MKYTENKMKIRRRKNKIKINKIKGRKSNL